MGCIEISHFYHLIKLPRVMINLDLVQCLRREKVVRVFKLNTGQDDHAIIFLDDYLNQVGILLHFKRLSCRSVDNIEKR